MSGPFAFSPLLASGSDEAMFVFLIVATAIMGFIAVVTVVAQNWRKAREAGYNARLKQIMLERGMSAADIKAVIDSGRAESEHGWTGRVARAQRAARRAAGLD